MKKIMVIVLVLFCSANLALAEEYRVVHRPGLFEAVGGLVVTAVTLPIAVVSGVAQGVTQLAVGSDELVRVNNPQTQQQFGYYYNQPMIGSPPFNPGYQFSTWYYQPSGIVFIAGSQHRRHSYNHGGHHNGQPLHQRR